MIDKDIQQKTKQEKDNSEKEKDRLQSLRMLAANMESLAQMLATKGKGEKLTSDRLPGTVINTFDLEELGGHTSRLSSTERVLEGGDRSTSLTLVLASEGTGRQYDIDLLADGSLSSEITADQADKLGKYIAEHLEGKDGEGSTAPIAESLNLKSQGPVDNSRPWVLDRVNGGITYTDTVQRNRDPDLEVAAR